MCFQNDYAKNKMIEDQARTIAMLQDQLAASKTQHAYWKDQAYIARADVEHWRNKYGTSR